MKNRILLFILLVFVLMHTGCAKNDSEVSNLKDELKKQILS